jgi:hypothetical protein
VEGFLVEIFWISWSSSGFPGKAVTLASGVTGASGVRNVFLKSEEPTIIQTN